MPGGIVQFPAGPGNPIYVYDNAFAANPTLGYTIGEINAAFPNDFELMVGTVSLNQWGGPRKQYLQNVPVVIGGQNTDGTNPTWLQDTNCDIYIRAGASFTYRTAGYSASNFKTTFGTRIASAIGGDTFVSGIDGVDFMVSGSNLVVRGQMLLYGSEVYANGGNVQLLDASSAGNSEIAGCIFRTSGSYVIGNNVTPSMDVYNSTFGSTAGTLSNIVTSITVRKTDNMIFACATPNAFIRTAAVSLNLQNVQFIGDPVSSDLVWAAGGGSGWHLMNPKFSSQAPYFSGAGPALVNPTQEYWYFNVKVCGPSGQPLANIPVTLYSDVDGASPLVDTKTFGDGDIGFTEGTTGFGNAVLVRDHYNQVAGDTIWLKRDRTYSIVLNGFDGTFPPVAGHQTRGFKFEWPGRDVFQGAFLRNGGEFKMCIMPVTLPDGAPSRSVSWDECDLWP